MIHRNAAACSLWTLRITVGKAGLVLAAVIRAWHLCWSILVAASGAQIVMISSSGCILSTRLRDRTVCDRARCYPPDCNGSGWLRPRGSIRSGLERYAQGVEHRSTSISAAPASRRKWYFGTFPRQCLHRLCIFARRYSSPRPSQDVPTPRPRSKSVLMMKCFASCSAPQPS